MTTKQLVESVKKVTLATSRKDCMVVVKRNEELLMLRVMKRQVRVRKRRKTGERIEMCIISYLGHSSRDIFVIPYTKRIRLILLRSEKRFN